MRPILMGLAVSLGICNLGTINILFKGNYEMNSRGQFPGPVQKAKETDKQIRTFLCGEAAEATGHQRLGCPEPSRLS